MCLKGYSRPDGNNHLTGQATFSYEHIHYVHVHTGYMEIKPALIDEYMSHYNAYWLALTITSIQ